MEQTWADKLSFWFERSHYWRGQQVNPYYWYWHDYRCRLEPWTYEWRRHVKKWWWVVLLKLVLGGGALIWLLLFPCSHAATWVKVIVMVAAIILVGFYAWLLLHLGCFALRFYNKIKGRRS